MKKYINKFKDFIARRNIIFPVKVQGMWLWHTRVRLIHRGIHEPEITNWIKQNIKPGMKVADVGAYIGYFSVLMSKMGAEVHAFEAHRGSYKKLLRNMDWNGCLYGSYGIYAAIGSTRGKAVFFESNRIGRSSIYPMKEDKVKPVIVDQYALDNFEIPFDFVKIDAEGAELDVLKGMKRLLKRGVDMTLELSPKWFRNNGQDPQDFLNELRRMGIKYYALMDDGIPEIMTDEKLIKYAESKAHINMFATTK